MRNSLRRSASARMEAVVELLLENLFTSFESACIFTEFLAAALAACSSRQYHLLVVVELLSEFELIGLIRTP